MRCSAPSATRSPASRTCRNPSRTDHAAERQQHRASSTDEAPRRAGVAVTPAPHPAGTCTSSAAHHPVGPAPTPRSAQGADSVDDLVRQPRPAPPAAAMRPAPRSTRNPDCTSIADRRHDRRRTSAVTIDGGEHPERGAGGPAARPATGAGREGRSAGAPRARLRRGAHVSEPEVAAGAATAAAPATLMRPPPDVRPRAACALRARGFRATSSVRRAHRLLREDRSARVVAEARA